MTNFDIHTGLSEILAPKHVMQKIIRCPLFNSNKFLSKFPIFRETYIPRIVGSIPVIISLLYRFPKEIQYPTMLLLEYLKGAPTSVVQSSAPQ